MGEVTKEFHIRVLGKLIEHLGVQMYKHRDAAIAELIANSWDAGAKNVWLSIPDEISYDRDKSIIIIQDDGCGMDENDMQDKYLVIGRNRRTDEDSAEFEGRKVMGRKGIGKLAGFGIATNMTIETWKGNNSIELVLNLNHLKNNPLTETKEDVEKKLNGILRDAKPSELIGDSETGSKITLSSLKQKSSVNIDSLHLALSRRFGRLVQGRMKIFINKEPLRALSIELHKNSDELFNSFTSITLEDGNIIKYSYSYSNNPLTKDPLLRGWSILVNGKTAQAPPFYFNVDTDGRSQHSSKYLIGVIEADYLDTGKDDDTDIIATDRQQIDWEREETKALWSWGRKTTQDIFNEIGERNSDYSMDIIAENAEYQQRMDSLDGPLQSQCRGFIKSIGKIKAIDDDMSGKEKVLQLADQIIKAFEYSHFIDVIKDIEKASDNPEDLEMLLMHLAKWEVLESRSILEVIKGRITIVDKLHSLITNDAPETANRRKEGDNMHDLIAKFPWLLNPDWQILDEEKAMTTQLRNWGAEDIKDADSYKKYDFLGMSGNGNHVIIEIKRSDHPIELDELQRIDKYKNKLSKAHPNITCVLIYSGKNNVDEGIFKSYSERDDFKLITWEEIYTRNKEYYNHYRAVLEGHISHPDFGRKKVEVENIKQVITKGTVHRSKEERKEGLGPQDIDFTEGK